MKTLVIVNGKPESGKTTFEQNCWAYLEASEMAWCHIISSIDPIKTIYEHLGWDGKKTDKARRDLSILKQMWIDNCNGPTQYIAEFVIGCDSSEDHIIFVDVREEDEIINLRNVLSAIGIKCTTLLIERDNNTTKHGNDSDDMVGSRIEIYDTIIKNSGQDLDKFYNQAVQYIDMLVKEN